MNMLSHNHILLLILCFLADFSCISHGNQSQQQQQQKTMEDDRVRALPGQPAGVDFDQYSGYVTVDPEAGRTLFYYFAESAPRDVSSYKPLMLWLTGGPGCSSFGYGAMAERGPFKVSSDTKTLFRNQYSWTNVANVIFLESPAGVGFSYSNTSSDYDYTGDERTAVDTYTFLIKWLERFPHYKTRDFYIAGESYGGHYVSELAYVIVHNNRNPNQPFINLKGISIGNGLLDGPTTYLGQFEYAWTHALMSDETYAGITRYCNFFADTEPPSDECLGYIHRANEEKGEIDRFHVYTRLCLNPAGLPSPSTSSSSSVVVKESDPCLSVYVASYLNRARVQDALHAERTAWNGCRSFNFRDSPSTVLPIIQELIANGIRILIYSGDADPVIPVTSTRYSLKKLKLPIEKPWRPWCSKDEVGGYVVEYKGLRFMTVRDGGHFVPTKQPERALTMISSFLEETLPPSSPRSDHSPYLYMDFTPK